jgi:hypothetical protein
VTTASPLDEIRFNQAFYVADPGKPVVLGGPRSMTGVPARLANT